MPPIIVDGVIIDSTDVAASTSIAEISATASSISTSINNIRTDGIFQDDQIRIDDTFNGVRGQEINDSEQKVDVDKVEKEDYELIPHVSQLTVDEKDKKTPDDWIRRHPEMPRLTGMHPFNSEPPAHLLRSFITPTSIHITRNHGTVPKLKWETHTFDVVIHNVDGQIITTKTFTMDEIASYPTITFSMTLTCAGNRRKEQNMTKQTVGFSWNSSATSCTRWTGVRMSSILKKAGLIWDNDTDEGESIREENRFVWMIGYDELPKGNYETCIELGKVMDPANDIILAYKQNGELLEPDRGFPIRALIPGYIGGRSVKWLKRLEVRVGESQSYYHFYDNRILPPLIDKDLADAEGWWMKPEYKFNELNINSVITIPSHGSVLDLLGDSGDGRTTFRGYAYSGGGRKVTRVEISFDQGKTWELTALEVNEKPNRYGKYWSWIFWSYTIDVTRLLGCRSVAVRAWDEANNTQPSELTWNVMGMGNNCWFRVEIQPVRLPQDGTLGLRFVFPTQGPGLQNPDGWMVPDLDGSKGGGGRLMAAQVLAQQSLIPKDAISTNSKNKRAKVVSSSTASSPSGSPKAAVIGASSTLVSIAAPSLTSSKPATVASSSASTAANADKKGGLRTISMDEVRKHASDDDCWIVVRGIVYDCTPFLQEHPGGSSSITMNGGEDCTEDFEGIHSPRAWTLLEKYAIGVVGELDGSGSSSPSEGASTGFGESDDGRISASSSAISIPQKGRERKGSDGSGSNASSFVDSLADGHLDFLTKGKVFGSAAELGTFAATMTAAAAAMKARAEAGLETDDSVQKVLKPALSQTAKLTNKILNPKQWIDFIVSHRENLTPDTIMLRFSPPLGYHNTAEGKAHRKANERLFPRHTGTDLFELGLPVGQHVMIAAVVGDTRIVRAYTPLIDADEAKQDFTLVVRVYRKNEHPKFPEGGKMSQHLDTLKVGDAIAVKGPLGHIIYGNPGEFIVHGKSLHAQYAVFVCGGTGITPAFRIASHILGNPTDPTRIYILYGARSPKDLLLKEEMDALQAKHPKRFHVAYTVDILDPGMDRADWPHEVGYVDEAKCRKYLPECNGVGFAGMCGPPPMIEFAVTPNLEKLGYMLKDRLDTF